METVPTRPGAYNYSYSLMHMQLFPICFYCLCAIFLLAPSQSGADVVDVQHNQRTPSHTALYLPHLVPPLLLTGTQPTDQSDSSDQSD